VSYVHTFGPLDGRPLLALHGLSGHGTRWRRFAEQQLSGFRVVAPDLRGHGQTTWDPPWNLERYAEDLVEVLDSAGLDRVPVMGHSFGGAICLYLAKLVPERVSRLVLVDPAIGLPPADALEAADDARDEEAVASLEAAKASQISRWPFASDEQIDEEVAATFVHHEDGFWRRRYSASMAVTAWSEMARPHILPPASTPTLLVPARDADFVTPEFVADCRSALGDLLTVHEVDSGHSVHLEVPAELGKLVNAFLT
jgi:lipase